MSKFALTLVAVIFYVCCISFGLGDASSGSSSGTGGLGAGVNPKNVRILGPGLLRRYRLLRKGLADGEDVYAEDENSFRKRQYDDMDYGHMRFGKRNQPSTKDYDDYGHLRFG